MFTMDPSRSRTIPLNRACNRAKESQVVSKMPLERRIARYRLGAYFCEKNASNQVHAQGICQILVGHSQQKPILGRSRIVDKHCRRKLQLLQRLDLHSDIQIAAQHASPESQLQAGCRTMASLLSSSVMSQDNPRCSPCTDGGRAAWETTPSGHSSFASDRE